MHRRGDPLPILYPGLPAAAASTGRPFSGGLLTHPEELCGLECSQAASGRDTPRPAATHRGEIVPKLTLRSRKPTMMILTQLRTKHHGSLISN